MKGLKYMMMMFAAAVVTSGCQSDIETPQIIAQEDFKAPVLSALNDIEVNSYTSNETVTFTCSPVDFGQPVQVLYEVYLTNGTTDARLVSGYSNVLNVVKSDINGIAINQLEVTANSTAQISAYAIAYVGESDLVTPKSNLVSFSIKTYKAPLRKYYMCGFFVNSWDISNAVSIWETATGTNVYEGMYYFTEDAEYNPGDSGFKVMPGREWVDDKGYDAFSQKSSNIRSSSDGNLVVDPGIWQISFDLTAMSISATAVSKVGVIGGFNDWSDDVEMTYDPLTNVWTSTEAISGEFKIRLNGAWDINYGGATKPAENMPEGETEAYELVSGAENINTPAGAHYVKLYADRTPWVIAFE